MRLLRFIFPLSAFLLFSCFGERTAGTSTGTENPEIKVSFFENEEPVKVSGSLEIFGANQNPLVDPDPIASFSLKENNGYTLHLDSLDQHSVAGIVPLLKTRAGASELAFNIVVKSSEKGGFFKGFHYNSKTNEARYEGFIINKSVPLHLSGFQNSVVNLEWRISNENPKYLYIPGSPYYDKILDLNSELVGLPKGQFNAKVVSNSGKVYLLEDPISEGEQNIKAIPIPVDSIDIDSLSEELKKYKVSSDTSFSSFNLQDFCFILSYGNIIIDVGEALNQPVQDLERTTWNELQDSDSLFRKSAAVYSSSNDQEEWIKNDHVHISNLCNGIPWCNTEGIRIDSIYFYEKNTEEFYKKLIFPGLIMDSISVIAISEAQKDTVSLFDWPEEDIPNPIPAVYVITNY